MNWKKSLIKESWKPEDPSSKFSPQLKITYYKVEKVIEDLEKDPNLNDPDLPIREDLRDYKFIFKALGKKDITTARTLYEKMDTAAQDYVFDDVNLTQAKAIARIFNRELNEEHWASLIKESWEPRKEPCTLPNCTHLLPEVNSSTVETWAKTLADKVIMYANLYKKYGKVELQNLEDPRLGIPEEERENRGKYDIENFLADTFAGDMPWNKEQSTKITRLLYQNPQFLKAMNYLLSKVGHGMWEYLDTTLAPEGSIKTSDFELDKSKGIEEPSEGLSVQPLTKMMMQRRQLKVGDLLIAEEDLIGPDPYKPKESFQYFTADHEYPFAGYTDTKWPTPGLAVKTDYQDQLMVVCFDPVPKLMEPREMQWAEKFSVVVESPENKEQKKMFDEYQEVPVKILEAGRDIGKGIAFVDSIRKKVAEDLHVRENLSLSQAKKLVEDSFEFLDAFGYIMISESGAFYLTPKGRKFLRGLG